MTDVGAEIWAEADGGDVGEAGVEDKVEARTAVGADVGAEADFGAEAETEVGVEVEAEAEAGSPLRRWRYARNDRVFVQVYSRYG